MLRIVSHTVPRSGRSNEHFPDGFELHLLPQWSYGAGTAPPDRGTPVHMVDYEYVVPPDIRR